MRVLGTHRARRENAPPHQTAVVIGTVTFPVKGADPFSARHREVTTPVPNVQF